MDQNTKIEVTKLVLDVVKRYNQTAAFSDKKITDNPTDALDIVNRRWATLNGTVANRPVSSVAVLAQRYFATDSSILMIYGGTGWVNSIGSIVAQNN